MGKGHLAYRRGRMPSDSRPPAFAQQCRAKANNWSGVDRLSLPGVLRPSTPTPTPRLLRLRRSLRTPGTPCKKDQDVPGRSLHAGRDLANERLTHYVQDNLPAHMFAFDQRVRLADILQGKNG